MEDLIRSQFTYNELLEDGININYTDSDIDGDKRLEDVIKRLDNPQLIKEILENDKNIGKDLLNLGLSIIELKRGGITAKELKENNVGPRELVDAGFTLQELKDVFNEKNDVDKFKEDKFNAKELYDAEFTLQFLYSDGRTDYGHGYNLDDIVKIVKEINKDDSKQIDILEKAGFSVDHIQNYYPSYMYSERN